MIVVATLRGWDGVRILGAFSSREAALEKIASAGFDIDDENLAMDVVKMNEVSNIQSIEFDCSNQTNRLTRVHIYDDGLSAPPEDNSNMNT